MSAAEIIVTAGAALLSGGLFWFFFGPKASSRTELRDGVQDVTIAVRGGYSPSLIRVRQGVPLRMTFDRQEGGECTSEVVFPDFRVRRALPAFAETTVQLLPDKTGEFPFACGMNMVHGRLIVEPDGDDDGSTGNGHRRSGIDDGGVQEAPTPTPAHTHDEVR